jgi:hypothetical protein
VIIFSLCAGFVILAVGVLALRHFANVLNESESSEFKLRDERHRVIPSVVEIDRDGE